jgi:hypothetical protein
LKNAAEKMSRGELFGAQHITRTSLRKHFSHYAYAQMPCFLGPRESAFLVVHVGASVARVCRVEKTRTLCTNLRHSRAMKQRATPAM